MLQEGYLYYDYRKRQWVEGTLGSLLPHCVRIKISAFGANRADLLQMRGLYPPPPGYPDIPGLECAGKVVACGKEVHSELLFRRVMALLPAGGYASHVDVEADLVLPLPDTLSYEQGAAIPESLFTAYLFLVHLGGMKMGNRVLIFSGAGGIGTMAIQLTRLWGAIPIAVCGSEEKRRLCYELGAEIVFLHSQPQWQHHLIEQLKGKVDIVLDTLGYHEQFPNLLHVLNRGGKWLVMGLLDKGEGIMVNPSLFLSRALTYRGQTLRALPFYDKWQLSQQVRPLLYWFESGELKPVVDQVFSYDAIEEGLSYLIQNKARGKVVFSWRKT
jgi:NADPH:quinone reductase-like Zn-dependent oxidoreductase